MMFAFARHRVLYVLKRFPFLHSIRESNLVIPSRMPDTRGTVVLSLESCYRFVIVV